MKKIISREPVTIPDGHGGILETIYVDVPAMQNEAVTFHEVLRAP